MLHSDPSLNFCPLRSVTLINYAVLGQREAALREVDMVLAMRPNDSNIIYNSACIYGILNQKKEALDLLREPKDTGFSNLDSAARDPDLVCLHHAAPNSRRY